MVYSDMDELERDIRGDFGDDCTRHAPETVSAETNATIMKRLDKLESLASYVDGRLDTHEDSHEKVDRHVERTRQLKVEIRELAEQGDIVLGHLSEGAVESRACEQSRTQESSETHKQKRAAHSERWGISIFHLRPLSRFRVSPRFPLRSPRLSTFRVL